MTPIYVTSGNTDTGELVENNDMTVYVGGTASTTSVTTGGNLDVIGAAVNTTVNSGGKMYLFGGTASVTTLSGAGTFLQVYSGQSESATVNSGAALYESGNDSLTTVNSGGVEFVFSGGVSTSATIAGQGSESIYSYGQQLAGGTAKKTIVGSGGIQNVNVHGTAIGTKVSASGLQYLESTGVAKGTKVYNGGTEELAGGTSIGTKISHGGTVSVTSGASAAGVTDGVMKNTTLGGTLELGAGAKATGRLTFTGGHGELIIDTTKMPSATISGFAPGDKIELAGVAYSTKDSVAVTSAGIVTISAGGHKYALHIAGAVVGSTNFTFGPGSVLTTSAPPMAFLTPPAVVAPSIVPAAPNPAAPLPQLTADALAAARPGFLAKDFWQGETPAAFAVMSGHGGSV